MTYVSTQPELLATAAADVAEIRSVISAATAAATGPTTAVMPAAADEVSAVIVRLFGAYAQEYRAVIGQAGVFHDEFAQALAAAGSAYAAAEAANAAAVSGALGALPAPVQVLLGTGATAAARVIPYVDPASPLMAPTVALVMGGAGMPMPPTSFVTAVTNYVNQNFAPVASAQAPFIPEGVNSDESVAIGVSILDSAIKQQIAVGNSVGVSGYSQSAVIASLEMENLANPTLNPSPPTATQLGFTLLGNGMNPNGGLLSRFPGFPAGQPLTLPSLGVTLYGATPPNTIYPTHIYTFEYDGYADFPEYPINFLADLNALTGINPHSAYPMVNPASLPPGYAIQQLPTSPGYTGNTTYYMITTPNGLPLLDSLRATPVIGNPLADLLQPDLTVLVNLGYGSPSQGWSTGYANVPTYFGLFPHVSQQLIASDLISGAQQGAVAFMRDISAESAGLSPSSISHTLTSMASGAGASLSALTSSPASLSPDSIIPAIQAFDTKFANAVLSAASTGYGVVLPTEDILDAAVIPTPAYDVDLFLSGIQQAIDGNVVGGLQYALVAPVAADTALYTFLDVSEAEVLLNAAKSIIGDFTSL